MALVPDNTLITQTPEQGRELAIMLARKIIGATHQMPKSERRYDRVMPRTRIL